MYPLGARPSLSISDDLALEDLARRRIFVAQIDVGFTRIHSPGGDEHSFQELMRALLEVISVLERPGLAFIGVDAQIARRQAGAHELPFSPRRESRPAETAQAGFGQDADHLFRRLARRNEAPGWFDNLPPPDRPAEPWYLRFPGLILRSLASFSKSAAAA